LVAIVEACNIGQFGNEIVKMSQAVSAFAEMVCDGVLWVTEASNINSASEYAVGAVARQIFYFEIGWQMFTKHCFLYFAQWCGAI